MDNVDVAGLRELLARATGGRWWWEYDAALSPRPATVYSDPGGPNVLRVLGLLYPGRNAEGDLNLVCAAVNALPALLDRLESAEKERREVVAFMDNIRDAARRRNPEGATLLDFMACWNEQYEARIKALEAENARLRGALADCDAVMDTAALHDLPQQLPPAYRDSWAAAHTAARDALEPNP